MKKYKVLVYVAVDVVADDLEAAHAAGMNFTSQVKQELLELREKSIDPKLGDTLYVKLDQVFELRQKEVKS